VKSEEVKAVSGVEIGAVCPLLLSMPIIIDKKIFSKEKINFGSGSHLLGIEMRTEDLGKVIIVNDIKFKTFYMSFTYMVKRSFTCTGGIKDSTMYSTDI